MNTKKQPHTAPAILAPAGNKASFLAALAAGADAIYCGLKDFSARMEAKNFSLTELTALTGMAHDKGVAVYVTFNTILKPDELDEAAKMLAQLETRVHPDALIIQDLSIIQLAKQIGFSGELHLSTLANVSFPKAMELVKEQLHIDRVVIPRELNIDEIKMLADACPTDLGLEVFVHGALCYGISGRCYWSSYLGGKSGLRGRCVQPCRRFYRHSSDAKRFFSCQDLSLDVLTKVLLAVPKIAAWKIEGRKKGPHYVYHTVKAYQILREGARNLSSWPDAKRQALDLLSVSLGRTGSHYYFLPQRPQNPIPTDSQTASGFLVGRMKGSRQEPYIQVRKSLLPGDVLRIGYEDESWHSIHTVNHFIPKKGKLSLNLATGKRFAKGTPVFLTDRREKELKEHIDRLEAEFARAATPPDSHFSPSLILPNPSKKRFLANELNVFRTLSERPPKSPAGVWLSESVSKQIRKRQGGQYWWWLPPVIWPGEEEMFRRVLPDIIGKGGRHFVLNAPWQISLFQKIKGLTIWAGPFCNVTNGLAVLSLQSMGFEGVIVSPELGGNDYLNLVRQSPLPLGMVISGNWPLCVSRVLSAEMHPEQAFSSPKGEQAWIREYDGMYWVYPNWKLDLTEKKSQLQKAGYTFFIHLIEPIPRKVRLKKRPGLWNWDLGLS